MLIGCLVPTDIFVAQAFSLVSAHSPNHRAIVVPSTLAERFDLFAPLSRHEQAYLLFYSVLPLDPDMAPKLPSHPEDEQRLAVGDGVEYLNMEDSGKPAPVG